MMHPEIIIDKSKYGLYVMAAASISQTYQYTI